MRNLLHGKVKRKAKKEKRYVSTEEMLVPSLNYLHTNGMIMLFIDFFKTVFEQSKSEKQSSKTCLPASLDGWANFELPEKVCLIRHPI